MNIAATWGFVRQVLGLEALNRPTVAIYLDSSIGPILETQPAPAVRPALLPEPTLQTFLSTTPLDITIVTYRFADQVSPWNPWTTLVTPPQPIDYAPVVAHAQDKGPYTVPFDGQIVFTNGLAPEVLPANPKRWLWLSIDKVHSSNSGLWFQLSS
jgi:hypothetical protein